METYLVVIAVAVVISIVGAGIYYGPALTNPTGDITVFTETVSTKSIEQALDRIDKDLLKKNADTLDGYDWDDVPSITADAITVDTLTSRLHINEYRVDLNVLGDANVSGDLNVMGDGNFNQVLGIGNDAAHDPMIAFISDATDGALWWEDAGNRFYFTNGITTLGTNGTVETDELVAPSWRAATGDYIQYGTTDNNWTFIIGNSPICEMTSTGFTCNVDTNFYGDMFVSGDINFGGDATFLGDLNVEGVILGTDSNFENVGINNNLYVANVITTAYFCDRYGVGCWDMRADPYALLTTGLEITNGDFQVLAGDSNFSNIGVSNNLYVDGIASFGSASSSDTSYFFGNTFPIMQVENITTATNAKRSAFRLMTTSTGDMVDGFGGGFVFGIKDTAGVSNNIAGVYAIRDGADNSGQLAFDAWNAGAQATVMTVNKDKTVDIGSTPSPNFGRKVNIMDDGIAYNARISLYGTNDASYPSIEFSTGGDITKRTLIRHDGEAANANDYMLNFYTTNNGSVLPAAYLTGDGNLILPRGGISAAGAIITTGDLNVVGNTQLRGDLNVWGDLNIAGNLDMQGVQFAEGGVIATGDSNFANLGISGKSFYGNTAYVWDDGSNFVFQGIGSPDLNFAGFDGVSFQSGKAIGNGSVAMGTTTTATGTASFAAGANNQSTGLASAVTGQLCSATGDSSFATGNSTTASGNDSVAMGNSTTASAVATTALGHSTTASGLYSAAVGYMTTASGAYSFAGGQNTEAAGTVSIALGGDTRAASTASTALGIYTQSVGLGSLTSGFGTPPVKRIFATGNGAVAMGYADSNIVAAGKGSLAMGYDVQALGEASVTLGKNLTNYKPNSVLVQDLNVLGDANFTNTMNMGMIWLDNNAMIKDTTTGVWYNCGMTAGAFICN